MCEGTLVCEASNAEGAPSLDAKAYVRTQVQSREHHLRVVHAAENGLRGEVMAAVKRFAADLAKKGMHD